ncbi:hypothetical protein C8R43DRAFT_938718 [Mycena crocata]|nr:hypothetical protein C8R43DRAFT_938718 [Mycena crocata]
MSRERSSGNFSLKKNTGSVASTRTHTAFYGNVNELPSQRSKSRSPSRNGSGSRSDPFTLSVTPAVKRKRSGTSLGNNAVATTMEEVDRGQRIKPKSLVASHLVTSTSSSSLRPKKEKELPRTASDYTQRGNPLDGQVSINRRGVDKGKARQLSELGPSPPPTPTYSGPLAAAEYERMRKELEALKKTVHDNKKQLKKQNKTIEELRAQVAAETLARQEHEKSLATISSKSRKNEELLQTIENSLQCQICIELLFKPYALTPCGHILCLECLQQWFRSAPSHDSDDEMDPEAQEEYILHRQKSCPCCRTTILRRPVPVFVVKNVVTALRAAAATPPAATQAEEDADPWKGLFLPDYESPSSDDEEGYDSYEEDGTAFFDHYSEDDLDGAEVELAMGLGLAAFPPELARFYETASEEGSASDSDEEEEEPEENEESDESDAVAYYTLARWQPPAHAVEFENVSHAVWKMQRRGCTPRLIDLFKMRYAHDEGLVAHVYSMNASDSVYTANIYPGRNRLFLGWNIDFDASDAQDDAESLFIARQLRDIRRHPERWVVTERHGYQGQGIFDARRLVPVEGDEEIYDTSDSEAYSNGEGPM